MRQDHKICTPVTLTAPRNAKPCKNVEKIATAADSLQICHQKQSDDDHFNNQQQSAESILFVTVTSMNLQ